YTTYTMSARSPLSYTLHIQKPSGVPYLISQHIGEKGRGQSTTPYGRVAHLIQSRTISKSTGGCPIHSALLRNGWVPGITRDRARSLAATTPPAESPPA